MNKLLITIGYYIHSCIKMRYKAAYRPQYVLGKLVEPTSTTRKNDLTVLQIQTLICGVH